jgi:hypothetical protein
MSTILEFWSVVMSGAGQLAGGDVGDWSEYHWLVVMSARLVNWSEDWSVQRWALAALAEWSAAILGS